MPFAPGTFTWALGIEDTCVYPPAGGTPLDEHLLTDHHIRMTEDVTMVAGLGAGALRYGLSWPLAHPEPGVFDWSAIDPVVVLAGELGLTLVADLVHYGTPTWLPGAFADPGYPDAVAAFAGAVAERYPGQLTCFTPLNEPVTTASFCGLRGVWPPYRTGWAGWVEVVVPIALGVVRSVAAIRRAQPSAVIVHVEAATDVCSSDPALADQVDLLRGVGWLPTDLVLGRVDEAHPLHGWLLANGASPDQLAELVAGPASVDVLGVNYYPDLTPRRLVDVEGEVVQVSYDRGAAGLREAVGGFAQRYGLPVAISETSVEGDDRRRAAWLAASVDEVRALRAAGYDVRGYTWWPLLDFVDWSWAAGGRNVEEFAVATRLADGSVVVGHSPSLGDPADGRAPFLRRMGIVRLDELSPGGSLIRTPTPVADDFARLAHGRPTSRGDGRPPTAPAVRLAGPPTKAIDEAS